MKLLNAKSFAELLDISQTELFRLVYSGQLPKHNYYIGDNQIPIWEFEDINNFFKVRCNNPYFVPEKVMKMSDIAKLALVPHDDDPR